MNVTTTTPTSATWQGTDVDMTTVDRQLSRLWGELSREAQVSGAVRTHIQNLIVYAPDRMVAEQISQMLTHLDQRTPSRTIILIADRLQRQTVVGAEAIVQCHPAGEMTLCSEQIIVTAQGRAADHLVSIVVPLLMPELPVYLWWPGQPLFGHRIFHRLLSTADQLVVDSAQFQSPGDGMANITRLASGRRGVNDFHWTRLTPWREVIAQFFDAPTWIPYAAGVRSARMEFGQGGTDPSRVTASVLLLLGWIACELGWEPETPLDGLAIQDVTLAVLQGERVIPIDLQFRDHGKDAAGHLMTVELVSQPKGEAPARFTVVRTPDMQHVEVRTAVHDGPEITRVLPLDLRSDIELLADELDVGGHDRLYDQVVRMASRLAGREIWTPT